VIAIVDYGVGNLGSVTKAFARVGAPALLTDDPATIARAEALVLPGDGAFGATMAEIRGRGLAEPLLQAARAGRPLLGICVGMQVLFEEGEEHGRHAGLGLLPGRVRRLPGPLPVPHMGWNRLAPLRRHPILDPVLPGAHVYFVHSYYCDAPAEVTLATTDYGIEFPAVVARANVVGMQFHPEKSQGVGLSLVASFARWCGALRHEPAAC
jgi:imidazole glycerol-phosphate synthase subunit HisH